MESIKATAKRLCKKLGPLHARFKALSTSDPEPTILSGPTWSYHSPYSPTEPLVYLSSEARANSRITSLSIRSAELSAMLQPPMLQWTYDVLSLSSLTALILQDLSGFLPQGMVHPCRDPPSRSIQYQAPHHQEPRRDPCLGIIHPHRQLSLARNPLSGAYGSRTLQPIRQAPPIFLHPLSRFSRTTPIPLPAMDASLGIEDHGQSGSSMVPSSSRRYPSPLLHSSDSQPSSPTTNGMHSSNKADSPPPIHPILEDSTRSSPISQIQHKHLYVSNSTSRSRPKTTIQDVYNKLDIHKGE